MWMLVFLKIWLKHSLPCFIVAWIGSFLIYKKSHIPYGWVWPLTFTIYIIFSYVLLRLGTIYTENRPLHFYTMLLFSVVILILLMTVKGVMYLITKK